MSIDVVFLILIAALLHALWNLWAKQVKSNTLLIWSFSVVATVVFTPVVVLLGVFSQVPQALGFLLVSAVLKLAYHQFTQQAYRHGDFSLVYPFARGVAPLLSTLGGVFLLQEVPSGTGLLGVVLVVLGIWGLTGKSLRVQPLALLYGALSALMISSYTLWDAVTLKRFLVSAWLIDWFTNTFRTVVLAPFVAQAIPELKDLWKRHALRIVGIGVCSSLSTTLVMLALQKAPVYLVAPMREVSVLFGVVLGIWFLREKQGLLRLMGAAVMVSGVILLTR